MPVDRLAGASEYRPIENFPLDEPEAQENHLREPSMRERVMNSPLASDRQPPRGFSYGISGCGDLRILRDATHRTMRLAAVLAVLAVLVLPQATTAWWHGPAFGAGFSGGHPWGPAPWVLFPPQRPRPDYRYSIPPGAPLSFDDPASGTTYCWSQTTGFYFACAFAQPVVVGPVPPPPPGISASRPDSASRPASGVLLFRLPREAEATIDGVPIGLSDGLGIHAVAAGRRQVVLRVSGRETAHTVDVRPHRIFTVTMAGIVPTEP